MYINWKKCNNTHGSCGAIAQLGERYAGSVEVRGSIPLGSTKTLISLYIDKNRNKFIYLRRSFFVTLKLLGSKIY